MSKIRTEMGNKVIADLHIHSRYSRATSKEIDIDRLSHWGKIKGLDILGTGDFTHPYWIKELKQKLKEKQEGIYEYKTKNNEKMLFLISVEVNNAFEYENKWRQVHNVILSPSIEVAEQINKILAKHSNLKEDGRPTLKDYNCEEMMEDLKSIDKEIEVFPAHAWTPWFGIYGSKSGFDSIKECFSKYAKDVLALETGLSSDPQMNQMYEESSSFPLISNSDAHSFWPWRLGREATLLYIKKEEITYTNIIKAIKNKELETIEVDPAYGKYHYDGHRKCSFSSSPEESEKYKNLCPICGKPLTLGVLHRVYELSKAHPSKEGDTQKYYTLLPLHEIIAKVLNKGINTKAVWKVYNDLINKFGSEYNALLASDQEIEKIEDKRIRDALIKNKEGKLKVIPGYDGIYGKIITLIEQDNKQNNKKINTQKTNKEDKEKRIVQRRLF